MDSASLFSFYISKTNEKGENRVYTFQIMPGELWPDIQNALDEFKQEFEKLRQIATAREEAMKQEKVEVVHETQEPS